MIPIPNDIIEKLKDGYFLIIKNDENTTAWRLKDNQLQNKVKHKTGTTNWMTIKYLILPMEAKYSFMKKED